MPAEPPPSTGATPELDREPLDMPAGSATPPSDFPPCPCLGDTMPDAPLAPLADSLYSSITFCRLLTRLARSSSSFLRRSSTERGMTLAWSTLTPASAARTAFDRSILMRSTASSAVSGSECAGPELSATAAASTREVVGDSCDPFLTRCRPRGCSAPGLLTVYVYDGELSLEASLGE